jgi:hypothetical protein
VRIITEVTVPAEMVEAMRAEHRLEVAKLKMNLVAYRQLLREVGIEPPDYGDDELLDMWNDCRAVISTASHFVARLGSAKELL